MILNAYKCKKILKATQTAQSNKFFAMLPLKTIKNQVLRKQINEKEKAKPNG